MTSAVVPAVRAPTKGIAFMVVALLLLTLSDAITKWLGQTLPLGQILCVRSFFSFIPIFVMAHRFGGMGAFHVNNMRIQLVRAGLFVATMALIAQSMISLPIPDAQAILFAGPLFITALSVPLLAEPVGWRRWAAVAVGFVGVVIMLRPTPDLLNPLALFPLAAALTGALRDIVTRKIGATETTVSVMTISTAAVIVAWAPTAFFGWAPLSAIDLLLLATSGILVGSAHFFMIESYRAAEAALVSPFKYSSIVWGVLLGYAIWGHVPDLWIITGGAVVIGSGLYILHRETRGDR